MGWREDIYKFRIVEVVNLSFGRHYQIKPYGKDGDELDYPFGKFTSKISIKNRVLELIEQIPHPCELEKEIEIIKKSW